MTQVTPPGWYPDPGQTNDAPATERWWDGKVWTEQIRPAEGAVAPGPAPHGTGAPGPAPYPADAPGPSPYQAGAPGPAPYQAGAPGPAPYRAAASGPYAADPAGSFGPVGPAYPAAGPAYPAYPGHPPAAPRRALRTGIAAAVAAAVLGSIGVGVYVLTRDDGGSEATGTAQGPDGRDDRGGPGERGDSGGPGGGEDGDREDDRGGAPGESDEPQVEDGLVLDPINGIGLPLPDGWKATSIGAGVQVSSADTYKCPGDTSKSCTRGGAYSAPAEALGVTAKTPEEAAKADIAESAEQSYGADSYGEITSHDVLASKEVTVAGQKGYRVRWKVITEKGDDGYVESLAFPSPADPRRLVIVRFGIDVNDKAPKQSVIDEITRGIKKSAPGGGTGQSV